MENCEGQPQRALQVVKKHALGVGFCVACAAILILFLVIDKVLEGTNPWGTTLTWSRCEATIQDNFLREPANTLSNLAFFFVGMYVLIAAAYDYRYTEWPTEGRLILSNIPFVQVGFGVALLFIGATSFYYHACAGDRPIAGRLDVTGVYVIIWSMLEMFTVLLLCLVGYIGPETNMRKVVAVYCLMYAVGIAISANYPTLFSATVGMKNMKHVMLGVFGLLIVQVLSSVVIGRVRKLCPNYDILLIFLSGIFLVAAVVSWYPEEVNGVCVPVAIELHALWHAALGVCLFFLFIFIRTLGNPLVLSCGALSHTFFPLPAHQSDVHQMISIKDSSMNL